MKVVPAGAPNAGGWVSLLQVQHRGTIASGRAAPFNTVWQRLQRRRPLGVPARTTAAGWPQLDVAWAQPKPPAPILGRRSPSVHITSSGNEFFFPSPISVHLEGVESLLVLSASPTCASSSTFLISISPKESESFCRPVATGCCPGRRMRRVREREPAAPRRSDTTCTDSRHTT